MADATKLSVPARTAKHREQLCRFGLPPLIEGEDATEYDELFSRVSTAIKLRDFLEEMWVRDVVDLMWDILRMRRLKAGLLTSGKVKGLREILVQLLDGLPAHTLSERWAARDQQAVEEVGELLASKGLTMDVVLARALSANIDSVDRIDRMGMNAEARRNAALRELGRHRAIIAAASQQASDHVIDAAFQDVPPKRSKQTDVR
jgi:hypothetical protein